MKCDFCYKEIDNELNMIITPPDGDCYHNECYPKHIKEKNDFFNNIHNDKWYEQNYPELNPSKYE